MKVLAIDTSNQTMTVALTEDEHILGEITLNLKKNHSITLMPAIEKLMTQAMWQPDDLDRIAVAMGPGSYTGIRIAVTTAKTLAWTLKKELVGVSSLAVIASNIIHDTALLVPMMDARRENVFSGGYQWVNGQLISVIHDQHTSVADMIEEVKMLKQPTYFLGDAKHFRAKIEGELGSLAMFVDDFYDLPHASRLAQLARKMKPVDSIDDFVPQYLRKTEAEINWLKTHDDKGNQGYVERV